MKDDVIECMLDEDCPDCKLAVGIGQLLNICTSIGENDCDNLHDKVMSEDMLPDEFVKIMVDRSKNTDQSEIVSEIVDLMS